MCKTLFGDLNLNTYSPHLTNTYPYEVTIAPKERDDSYKWFLKKLLLVQQLIRNANPKLKNTQSPKIRSLNCKLLTIIVWVTQWLIWLQSLGLGVLMVTRGGGYRCLLVDLETSHGCWVGVVLIA